MENLPVSPDTYYESLLARGLGLRKPTHSPVQWVPKADFPG
jgi:hypothetical protein